MVFIPFVIFLYSGCVYLVGTPMTRTILNWSELLVQYKGNNIESQSRLKKWSEMDDPQPEKSSYYPNHRIGSEVQTSSHITQTSVTEQLTTQDEKIIDAEIEYKPDLENDENKPYRMKYKIVESNSKKIPMQDTESIPELYANGNDEYNPSSKLSAQESLMIDLLELNLKNTL